jgi:hypothetical protein
LADVQLIVREGRRFIHEGVLDKITPRFVQTRTVYLFNDCFLFASRILNTNFFQAGKMVALGPAWLRDLSDTAGVFLFSFSSSFACFCLLASQRSRPRLPNPVCLAAVADVRHAFQIVVPKRTYTLYAKSDEAKGVWLDKLRAVIDRLVADAPELVGAPRAVTG